MFTHPAIYIYIYSMCEKPVDQKRLTLNSFQYNVMINTHMSQCLFSSTTTDHRVPWVWLLALDYSRNSTYHFASPSAALDTWPRSSGSLSSSSYSYIHSPLRPLFDSMFQRAPREIHAQYKVIMFYAELTHLVQCDTRPDTIQANGRCSELLYA